MLLSKNRVARSGTKGGIGEKHGEKLQRVIVVRIELQKTIEHHWQII